MRIAYLNVLPEPFVIGPYRRMEAQAKIARKLNLSFDFHLFTNAHEKVDSDLFHVHSLPCLRNPLQRHVALRKAIFEVVQSKYDVVILRHITFSSVFYKIFKNRNFSLITEHHTKEEAVCWNTKKYVPFALEKLFAKKCFQVVDGIVAVSEEIKDYELRRSGLMASKAAVIPNGIAVDEVSFTKFQPFKGKELHLLMVTTGVFDWNGIDRVIHGMRRYRNGVRIMLHIAGNIAQKDIAQSCKGNYRDIELHGTLHGEALDRVYALANIGLSCLAVHRIGVSEIPPLRTREYMSRGLPFVFSYRDPDIKEQLPFCMEFSAKNKPVSMRKLIQFAESVSQHPEKVSEAMRAYAKKYMDLTEKMKGYAVFVNQVAGFQRRA